MQITLKKSTLKLLIAAVLVFTGISFVLFNLHIAIPSSNIGLGGVFLTGLLTGGLTCLAVQGGLLAATIAQREEEKLKEKTKLSGNALPILSFLGAKLVAYTLLGFLLGMLGSVVKLSLGTQVTLQFVVAIFMIGTALNILNVHPIFRYFVIQPPKFLTRLVRSQSKSKSMFAPLLLGAFTVFIPCGTTQAMMALAIGSESPVLGAAILFAFVLGTSPLFFILGYFATKLGDTMQQKFMRFAAVALILLALYNLDDALALSGSNFTLSSTLSNVWCTVNVCDSDTATTPQNIVQAATITISDKGYTPDVLTIKAGSQVKLHLTNSGGAGCTQTFTIPTLGIVQSVPLGTQSDITFTAPSQPGQLAFMCSMGMYRGTMNVI